MPKQEDDYIKLDIIKIERKNGLVAGWQINYYGKMSKMSKIKTIFENNLKTSI